MASNNFLKQILQGGACNTDATQPNIQSSNPVRSLLQEVFLGKARTKQKLGSYYPDEVQDIPQQIPQHQNNFINENIEGRSQRDKLNKDMNEYWSIEESKQRNQERIENIERRQIWEQNQKQAQRQNQQIINERQSFLYENHNQPYMWNNDFYMRPMLPQMQEVYHYYPSREIYPLPSQPIEKVSNTNSNKNTQVQINNESIERTINLMEKDSDPRFRNSKYLEFLKRIQKGEDKQNLRALNVYLENTEHKETEATKNEDRELNFDMETAWAEAEAQINEEEHNSNEKVVLETCKLERIKMSEISNQSGEINIQEIEFEEAFQKAIEEVDKAEESKNEDEEQNEEEFDLGLESSYKFTENNPYSQEDHCLEKALDSLNNGDTSKAILYLESILQKKPEDEGVWMLLGKVYQDNDEEGQARNCLLKTISINSSNLGALLSLGVSLTNVSEDFRAMKCLSRWISKHPKLERVIKGNETIKEICQRKDYKMTLTQLRQTNQDLIDIFDKSCKVNPNDPELHCSQAVLNFISKNYVSSLFHFNEALKYDPTNYSLWNKLGSTLACLSKPSEAIEAYYRALEYKPNFVRVWVNLAATQAFKGEYEEAARLYLTALSINSRAVHIWEHLRITLIAMGRHDLADKTSERDLTVFSSYFDVISLEDLPSPEIEYKELHKNYLYKECAEEWVKAFN